MSSTRMVSCRAPRWPTVEISHEQFFQPTGLSRVAAWFTLGAMRGSWAERHVRRPMERLTEPFRDWVGRLGSVTAALIWINVVVFLVQLLCEFVRWPVFEQLFALSGAGLRSFFFWQPVTYMFLHGGLFHILINLLILWFLGREVEYFIGPKYFTRLYFLGGVVGAALWLAFNYYSPAHVVGASAAVLACAIAFATLFPDREITLLLFFVLPVTIKAKYLAWGLVALDIVPLLQHATTGVAHLAHLGGALLGYVYIKQLGYGPQPRWLRAWETMTDRLKPRRRRTGTRRVSDQEMTPEEFIRDKVDPILDKIAREGIHSLTRAERKILESAKDYLRKR